MTRLYTYIGPGKIEARLDGRSTGRRIESAAALLAWVRQADAEQDLVPATFVIDANGVLLLADRRSEHVAFAKGGPVPSAGELFICLDGNTVEVVEASNQSTGYCPEPESWPAGAAVLDRLDVRHHGRFTQEVTFRKCEQCGERNIVKEGWLVCGVYGADLPERWNC
jgi:hypothetical protein